MSLETQSNSPWSPNLNTFAPADVVPDALVLKCSTVIGSVEGDAPVAQCAYIDDSTSVGFVDEGADITEQDPTLSSVSIATGKVAQLVKVSNEQALQQGMAELSQSMRRSVTAKANTAFVAQAAPTSPDITPPAGLLNQSPTDGGAVATDLDALVDIFADIESAGGKVDVLLLAPDSWASLRKLKTATGSNASLIGAGTNDAQRLLLDVPVLVSSAVTSGTGLAIDRAAVVSAVGQVTLAKSSDVYFASDSIGLRCTWRFGARIVHTDRVAKFTVTDPDA